MIKKSTIALVIAVLLAGCAAPEGNEISTKKNSPVGKGEIQVVASFYPLAEFSQNVGGELVEVVNITPYGAEPHEYEPTPLDIGKIQNADLFIYNGEGQEPWAEKISEELKQKGLEVVEMTKEFTLMESEMESDQEEEEHEHGKDPHIWLDPSLASKQVELIRDALVHIDPENEALYTSNAKVYTEQLTALDQAFKEGLSNCKKQDIITSHAAFGYMTARYGLNQIGIAGLSTEEEPSARRLGEIAKLAEEKNIQYIFFEELVSPRLSETIAREVGAQTLVLNPVEGLTKNQIGGGENYITVMKANLDNLRIALECS